MRHSFPARRHRPSESPDVYLADLRRLSALSGGIPEPALACTFVAGLPDDVSRTIRTECKAEDLALTVCWLVLALYLSTSVVDAPDFSVRFNGAR